MAYVAIANGVRMASLGPSIQLLESGTESHQVLGGAVLFHGVDITSLVGSQ